jgi:hypothetical protein
LGILVKKAPAVAGAFFVRFRPFLRVVLENPLFFDGVFVVKMWWIRGEMCGLRSK